MQPDIFNAAMAMTLEWGENFRKPIQERLRHRYPALSSEEADAYAQVCRDAMYYAFGQIERAHINEISEAEALADIQARYPLIDADNLGRLASQGHYYAWRDHG